MNTSKISLLVALMMTLAACGGSNSTRPSTKLTVAPPPPPTPILSAEDFRTTEFDRNWGLGAIGAEYAYAEGYTGAGQIIGIVDFNFDLSSSEVNYHNASLDLVAANKAIYDAQFLDEPAESVPHGLAVAAAAAAIKDDFSIHGVAFDARVLAVDFFSGVNSQDYSYLGGVLHVSDPYSYLMDRGVRVVNLSFGSDGGGAGSDPTVDEWYGLENPAIVIERGGLLVVAAGNNADDPDNPGNGTEPQLSNLAIRDDADQFGLLENGPGAYIIVGSVDENNVISSFSDRAGAFDPTATTQTMDIYLVAPGEGLSLPWEVDGDKGLYCCFDGTSFAAPHVAGAAAILFQRWPTLTAKEVADILFTTATDLGDPGVDAIYGRGLLNLAEAITPQGAIVVNFVDSSELVKVDDFSLIMGSAFGDGTPSGITSIMGLDKYDRDFYLDLSSGVYNLASNQSPMFEFMENTNKLQFNQWQVGGKTLGLQISQDFSADFLETQSQLVKDTTRAARAVSAFAEGKFNKNWGWKVGIGVGLNAPLSKRASLVQLLSMQGQATYLSSSGNFALVEHNISDKTSLRLGVDVSTNTGLSWHEVNLMQQDLPRYTLAMKLDHNIGAGTFGFSFGQVVEKQSVLGSRSFGGFAVADSAATSFVGFDGAWGFGNGLRLSASFKAGVTNVAEVSGSFFEGFNDFASTAWQVQFEARDVGFNNSVLVFSTGQPLRVENAVLTRNQAVGIDANRAPIYQLVSSSLNPSGREVALEAAYVVRGKAWSLQTSLVHRIDAGHTKGLSDTTGLLWLKRNF